MDIDAIKQTFFLECAEQLAEVEEALIELKHDPDETEHVHAVFRAVHSIKGGAGSFGFEALVRFSHIVENGLDEIRKGKNPGADARLEVIARAIDVLADVVAATREQRNPPDVSEISAEINQVFGFDRESGEQEEQIEFDAVPIDLAGFEEIATEPQKFLIHISPDAGFYRRGDDMQFLLRSLCEMGEVEIICDHDRLPDLAGFDLEKTYLSWTVTLATKASEAQIRERFEWVSDAFELEIICQTAGGSGEDLEALLAELEQNDLANEGQLEDMASAAEASANTPDTPLQPASFAPARPKPTIRVESEKVDRLIDLMGEAVISQAMVAQTLIAGLGKDVNGLHNNILTDMQNLMRELQESVMAIRAQPVKPVFVRMSRVVREACAATGKKADLLLEGESTEVDTTIIENLTDPLTHIIRNAIDHGIEVPEERLRLGKPEAGTIKVSAYHASGRIFVCVEDDGTGINRERILQKALERGIVEADHNLSEAEIDALIFAPGFSTAKEITDLSGRGVGLDVVRQSVEQLGGRVSITSDPGRGTQLRFTLPLTLAILDGMIVRIADEVFVVPLASVIETLSVNAEAISVIGGKRVIQLRDELLPVIDVGEQIGFARTPKAAGTGTILVVESQDGHGVALLIDEIEGQQQVVIKSLESNFERVPNIAAATILGSGNIALILDIDDIVASYGGNGRSAMGQTLAMERMSA